MTDEPQPTVREHSDEGCMAIERERLAQIAELEAANAHIRSCWELDEAAVITLRRRIVESDAEITRLRGVIAQLREDWRPKAQQEVAAMTAAREVARLWVNLDKYEPMEGQMRDVLDRLVEAFERG